MKIVEQLFIRVQSTQTFLPQAPRPRWPYSWLPCQPTEATDLLASHNTSGSSSYRSVNQSHRMFTGQLSVAQGLHWQQIVHGEFSSIQGCPLLAHPGPPPLCPWRPRPVQHAPYLCLGIPPIACIGWFVCWSCPLLAVAFTRNVSNNVLIDAVFFPNQKSLFFENALS